MVDANVLIYSVDRDAADHEAARTWMETALSGQSAVLLPWISLLAFMRLITHPRVYQNPQTWEQASSLVRDWLDCPNAWVPQADERHLERMTTLLAGAGRGGNLINDAHLAALALQHDATVVTYDTDFAAFPGVRWETPGT